MFANSTSASAAAGLGLHIDELGDENPDTAGASEELIVWGDA